jgi:hypothetical protein
VNEGRWKEGNTSHMYSMIGGMRAVVCALRSSAPLMCFASSGGTREAQKRIGARRGQEVGEGACVREGVGRELQGREIACAKVLVQVRVV